MILFFTPLFHVNSSYPAEIYGSRAAAPVAMSPLIISINGNGVEVDPRTSSISEYVTSNWFDMFFENLLFNSTVPELTTLSIEYIELAYDIEN